MNQFWVYVDVLNENIERKFNKNLKVKKYENLKF